MATGADGTFAASYQVPPTETPGTYTVSAAARGQTATATFTRNPTEINNVAIGFFEKINLITLRFYGIVFSFMILVLPKNF